MREETQTKREETKQTENRRRETRRTDSLFLLPLGNFTANIVSWLNTPSWVISLNLRFNKSVSQTTEEKKEVEKSDESTHVPFQLIDLFAGGKKREEKREQKRREKTRREDIDLLRQVNSMRVITQSIHQSSSP